jgi:hypothetical protein
MVLIKVQYDAYNRQFRLLSGDLRHSLEDGETYVLIADVSAQDVLTDHAIVKDVESVAT